MADGPPDTDLATTPTAPRDDVPARPPAEEPRKPRLWRRPGATAWWVAAAVLTTALGGVQAARPLPHPALVTGRAAASFTVPGTAFTPPWPDRGQAAVTVAGSGVVSTFGEQRTVPIASVAKVMTAYVILQDHPLKDLSDTGPQIGVDAKAVQDGTRPDESRITGLTAGQQFGEQDMLRMLMIPSGNNIARLLARWDTGSDSETAFVRKMNDAARSLGMADTTYTDPSGLDPGTVSTAVDQLKLAQAVMQSAAFRQVVATPDAAIPGLPQRIVNSNRLLVAGLGVQGIKTGSTSAAGGALSWAADRTVAGTDQLVLGTMLDQHAQGSDPNGADSLALVLANSKKVITAVGDALTRSVAVRKGEIVGYLDDELGDRTPVVATGDAPVTTLPGQHLDISLAGTTPLPHTAKAGTVVGTVTVGRGPGAVTVPVALQRDFCAPSLIARLTRL
ncbi:D-alanyl-D-alanine carboxypeptidase family protein [Kitasatospora sp. NPDC101176]|uniref:D-alanyl-D-alanine carboxypeptidase family protein n=1 Tax=Kitasatospora sp. NPDC101176 TaxID=3364099 RepID=UPI0038057244